MSKKLNKARLQKLKKLLKTYDSILEQDYITGLDYSNILLDAYCKTMEPLHVLKNTKVRESYDIATEAMADLYQVIGQELYKNEEINRKPKKRS